MQKFASETIWAWEIVCGKVLIVDSYSCFLDFLILSSTSVICVFWRIYPFIQVYLLYCCTCVHNSLLLFFGCQYFLQWCLFFIPDIDIFTYWYFYFFCFFFLDKSFKSWPKGTSICFRRFSLLYVCKYKYAFSSFQSYFLFLHF